MFRSLLCAFITIPFSIIMATLVILVSVFSRRVAPTAIMRAWAKALLKMYGVTVGVKGLENVARDRPCIYMANHASMVDIPVIIAALPVDLRFIFKKELLFVPFVGQAIYLMGMIPIDRLARTKAAESLRKAGEQIRKGKHILIFPEGTRTRDGKLQPFKKGGFFLAQQENIDIVPITVINSRKLCGRNSMLARTGHIDILIHPRVVIEDYPERQRLVQEVKDRISDYRMAGECEP